MLVFQNWHKAADSQDISYAVSHRQWRSGQHSPASKNVCWGCTSIASQGMPRREWKRDGGITGRGWNSSTQS